MCHIKALSSTYFDQDQRELLTEGSCIKAYGGESTEVAIDAVGSMVYSRK